MKNSNIKKYIIIFISMIALLITTISFMPKSTKGKAIKFKNDSHIETKLISEVFNLVEKQLPNHQDLGFINIKNEIKNSKTGKSSTSYTVDSDTSGSFHIIEQDSKFQNVLQLSNLTMYHLIYKIKLENSGENFSQAHQRAAYAYSLYILDLFFKSKTYLNYQIQSLESDDHIYSKFKEEIMKKYLDLKNGLELEKFIKNIE